MENDTTATESPDYGVGDYLVVPKRITWIEEVPYVRCPTHGLIPLAHQCAKSPGDHWCRTAAHPAYDPATGEHGLDDQATAHEAFAQVQAAKLAYIAHLHVQGVAEAGEASGFCAECTGAWPCRTAHMANAWGEREACEATGWCKHANVSLPKP